MSKYDYEFEYDSVYCYPEFGRPQEQDGYQRSGQIVKD